MRSGVKQKIGGSGTHSGILNIVDYKCTEDICYLVLPDLSTHATRDINILSNNLQSIGTQMIDILEYVHDAGLLYCDVKFDNFIFTKNSSTSSPIDVYLIDFGSAEIMKNHKKHIKLLGTPLFASPTCHAKSYTLSILDDLLSVVYVLLYISNGYHLPWENMKNDAEILECKTKFAEVQNHNKHRYLMQLHNYIYNKLISTTSNQDADVSIYKECYEILGTTPPQRHERKAVITVASQRASSSTTKVTAQNQGESTSGTQKTSAIKTSAIKTSSTVLRSRRKAAAQVLEKVKPEKAQAAKVEKAKNVKPEKAQAEKVEKAKKKKVLKPKVVEKIKSTRCSQITKKSTRCKKSVCSESDTLCFIHNRLQNVT